MIWIPVLLTTLAIGQAPADLPPVEASAVVPAPVQKVWDAFTTSEGAKSWMVAHAELDTRVGGLWKTHYSKDGKIGDEGTIVNEVLCLDPLRMFSIRIQKTPKRFPFPNSFRDMWTVVYFEPIGNEKTKVTVRGLGIKDTEEGRKMRAFFEQGNKYELDMLVKHFQK